MSETPKTFRDLCYDHSNELDDLTYMVAVLEQCLDGDLSGRPKNGYVTVTENEATAINWIATRVICKVRDLAEEFEKHYDALKGTPHAPA